MGAADSLPHPPGPRPVGDPGAMRALADELRRIGERAGHLGGLTFSCAEWQGYSAMAFGPRLRAEEDAARAVGVDLRLAAHLLDVAADDVSSDLLRWNRAHEAYEAAVAAAGPGERPRAR